MNRKSFITGFFVFLISVIFSVAVCNASSLGVNVTNPRYPADVSSSGNPTSQLHFSLSGNDVGGWLTSVSDNNFFVSSGAVWDSTVSGWIQKSPDGQAIIAGSGTAGFRILTRTGCPQGTVCPMMTRMRVDYAGNVGFGAMAPSYPVHVAGGAYCTGTKWIDVSSRKDKDNIEDLNTEQALLAFNKLNPVTFTYKTEKNEKHVGFIAEDVPDLVATPNRNGLSAMDIVAVLTKVVQEQNKMLQEQRQMISELTEKVDRLEEKLK